MLNGIAPILIFNFYKKISTNVELQGPGQGGEPLLADEGFTIPLVPIPIYLDASLTGLHIMAESKNIDVLTKPQTKTDGGTPEAEQTGLNSLISIEMEANKDSLGLNILSAMADIIFEKVTSKEYDITYLHGAVTVFGGLLEGFSISQDANTNLYRINLQLSRATGGSTVKVAAPSVIPIADTAPIPGVV